MGGQWPDSNKTFGGFLRSLPMVGTIMTALHRSEVRRRGITPDLDSIGYGTPGRAKAGRDRKHPTKKRVTRKQAKVKRQMQKASRRANR